MLRRWWRFHLSLNRRFVRHLEQQILYERARADAERRRAEIAIDAYLGSQGKFAVTPPDTPMVPSPQSWMQDAESAAVGNPGMEVP
jgi:hypothetical protein